MKKTILLLVAFISIISFTKAQDGINYQAVVRDDAGELMKNEAVAVEFSIVETSTAGVIVYTETHALTTNNFGNMVALIGQGTPTLGVFADVDWASDKHFLNVVIDGTDMGTTEFLSVPYALHAKTADELTDPLWFRNSSYSSTAYTTQTARINKSFLNLGNLLELTNSSLSMFPNPPSIDTVLLVSKTGKVQRNEKTGSADMLPIAYGSISSAGVVNSGTNNFSCSTSANPGQYRITFEDETYHYLDFITSATVVNSGYTINATSVSGDLYIKTYDSTGAPANAIFNFVTYKP